MVVQEEIAIFLVNGDIEANLLPVSSLVNESVSVLGLLVVNAFDLLTLVVLRTDVFIDELEDIFF